MESNTPKTSKSSYSNILPSPNNPSQTPTDVRCVTQTQDSEWLFETPDSGPDHQHILNALCAAEQADNTPQWESSQVPLAPTPVIPSPDQAVIQQNVTAELFKLNSKG